MLSNHCRIVTQRTQGDSAGKWDVYIIGRILSILLNNIRKCKQLLNVPPSPLMCIVWLKSGLFH